MTHTQSTPGISKFAKWMERIDEERFKGKAAKRKTTKDLFGCDEISLGKP